MSVCKQCGMCCRWVAINFGDTVPSPANNEWVKAHGMILVKRKEGNVLFIPCRCDHLTKKNKCKIYDRRPPTCRDNPTLETLFMQPDPCAYWEEADDAHSEKVVHQDHDI